MRRNLRRKLGAVGMAVLASLSVRAYAQDHAPLRLIQTIPLPNVKGRMDHLGVDLKGKRLFAASLENNTLEVIDLKAGKRVFSIPGQSKPQGVFYSSDFNKLFVDNGGDRTFKVYDGDTFKLIANLPVGNDSDHLSYDPAKKYLSAGLGDSKSGGLSIIDAPAVKHIGDIKVDARPGGIKIEKSGPRIFLRFTGTGNLAVIDREKREVIAKWPVPEAKASNSLALDETNHRLFDATSNPPLLLVSDTESHKKIAHPRS